MRKILKKLRNTIFPDYPLLQNIRFLMKHVKPSTVVNSELHTTVKLYEPYGINNSKIGNYTYLAHNSKVINTRIGKFCSIGPNFCCGRGIHPVNGVSTSPMFYSMLKQNGYTIATENKIREYEDIEIGNDVFIGINVTVLDGVKIGDGAVIGAGAVVVNDIPPYSIAVGVPAKVVKYRFTNEIIEKLLRLRWWDRELSELTPVERHFFEIEKFIEAMSDK
jgi:virginiamycin A acetyltransferase